VLGLPAQETTGLFTLAAAALGISLVAAVNAVLEGRRERALLRQAKRLMAVEVNLLLVTLQTMVELRRYPREQKNIETMFPTSAWVEYQALRKSSACLELLRAAGSYLRELPDRLAGGQMTDPAVPVWADAIEGAEA
jgi:hypothetical protein